MMKTLLAVFFLSLFNLTLYAQPCAENAKTVAPVLSEKARTIYETKLAEARADFEKTPNNADSMIWLGRRAAYLGNYREAIEIFSEGIGKFPRDARFYRHRGHRLLTIRCFDDAVKDFETAAKLVKGKADEIEPDGLPNARNTPTSTVQTNIYYHLGLAYYLKGDFRKALKAYRKCEELSKNPDMLVASKHWVYMTQRRLGKTKEAAETIADVRGDLDIIENDDYYKLVRLYQGKLRADDLVKEIGANTLSSASLGYGLGNWFLYNGEKEKAREIFQQIASSDQWASFGFIASEAELKK